MDTLRSYLDFPFTLDEQGRSAATGSDDHIRDMIALVLFTSPGERANRPEFGCGVKQLVFAPLSDALAAATEQLIHGALIRWLDPVISLEKVETTADDATLEIRISYVRRETGEQRVEVFRHPVPV
ncbi:GPW/gp25 family protein [Nordella sp. HKS 07]|uniref:GPW/gp25 family protein n=1 Tax=Nordella sp. HKS 07 TaxID=2712222 RepID=UPI0013E1EE2C|nr:GPW/gp25 family protein [Nordella sp. HKS 07]QIG49849.1 GPW/gp25 family protein [Nordella sp. HKS 07]